MGNSEGLISIVSKALFIVAEIKKAMLIVAETMFFCNSEGIKRFHELQKL
jgi:hypothetical protein